MCKLIKHLLMRIMFGKCDIVIYGFGKGRVEFKQKKTYFIPGDQHIFITNVRAG